MSPLRQLQRTIVEFIRLESASGILLFLMVIAAILLDNSSFQKIYQTIFYSHKTLILLKHEFHLSVTSFINEGLMTLFFLLMGLEIKREILDGELDSLNKILLPAIAAIGGMIMPAIIYISFNYHNPVMLRGWAIPTATDIAFALGIMSLLGKRVPLPLKLFLMALAIFDDMGAIIIIAIFYVGNISTIALMGAIFCFLILLVMHYLRVISLWPYLIVGLFLWFLVLLSGIHASIAGVLLAITIPLQGNSAVSYSPLRELEQRLHPFVAFIILPLFALANAGVSLAGINFQSLIDPITIGITLGLLIGKQLGIFLTSWLTVKSKWAKLPSNTNWLAMYGTSLICGVGFTMSLFIGNLAFSNFNDTALASARLGIMLGSSLSAIIGYICLNIALPTTPKPDSAVRAY